MVNKPAIKLVILDVDGVLTDGSICYGPDGEYLKTFHVRDGHRILMARSAGIRVGIMTGRDSAAIRARVRDLKLDPAFFAVKDKVATLQTYLDQEKIAWDNVASLGDDLPELGLIQRVAFFGAVADASHHLSARAHYVCRTPAGRGAVAEFLELILRREGCWKIDAQRLGVSL